MAFGESDPSPERINDGSCRRKRDFALLHPLAHGGEVSPTLFGLLEVIGNTSFALIEDVALPIRQGLWGTLLRGIRGSRLAQRVHFMLSSTKVSVTHVFL